MHLVKPVLTVLGAAIVALSLPISSTCEGQTAPPAPPATIGPNDSQFQYKEIQHLEQEGKYEEALAKANAAVEADPKNIIPYVLRGHIYSEMNQLDKSDADFVSILQIDPNNFPAQFNRCEIKLSKKDYDGAREGFTLLEKNPDWGDLAAYKVFVCDLFAGHELASRSELETFNKAGTHPSYFYANATWSFYHKETDKARSWVNSAEHIYPRKTIYFYSATLVDAGYIKLPPPELKVP
jgi:tetratricopeptide (TPR) repeat protein